MDVLRAVLLLAVDERALHAAEVEVRPRAARHEHPQRLPARHQHLRAAAVDRPLRRLADLRRVELALGAAPLAQLLQVERRPYAARRLRRLELQHRPPARREQPGEQRLPGPSRRSRRRTGRSRRRSASRRATPRRGGRLSSRTRNARGSAGSSEGRETPQHEHEELGRFYELAAGRDLERPAPQSNVQNRTKTAHFAIHRRLPLSGSRALQTLLLCALALLVLIRSNDESTLAPPRPPPPPPSPPPPSPPAALVVAITLRQAAPRRGAAPPAAPSCRRESRPEVERLRLLGALRRAQHAVRGGAGGSTTSVRAGRRDGRDARVPKTARRVDARALRSRTRSSRCGTGARSTSTPTPSSTASTRRCPRFWRRLLADRQSDAQVARQPGARARRHAVEPPVPDARGQGAPESHRHHVLQRHRVGRPHPGALVVRHVLRRAVRPAGAAGARLGPIEFGTRTCSRRRRSSARGDPDGGLHELLDQVGREDARCGSTLPASASRRRRRRCRC